MMKKVISIFLSAVLLLSVFSVISITANATSKTAQEAVDWACAQIGNSIDVDGAYGCQCVDLIVKYYDILGVRRVWGNGYDYINNALPENGWYRTATPSVGDIVVWGVNVDIARETGHVGIVVNVNGGYIDYVDQNSWEYGAKVGRHNGYLASKASTYIHPAFSGNPDSIPTPTGTRTVVDGDYYIASALDNNKVLDIDDGQISNNKANAQLWNLLKGTNQVFSVRHIGDGYYNIICKKSGKCLEVEGGWKEAGTNVQQYDGNGTDAQQWVIKETGDGYFYIVSKCSGLYLDVDNYNIDNGTNIKVYTGNSSDAQKWRFIQLGSHSFCDGDYYITSALNNNKVLDIDDGQISNNKANAQLWDLLNWENQIFTIKHIGEGYYSIVCKKSGKCLEIEGGYASAGTNVQQYDSNGTDAQQWVIKEVGDYYCITSKRNGLCLDLDNYNTDNGTNIKVYSTSLSDAQKWRFIPIGTQTISEGEYFISTALDSNKVLDIDDGQISNNKANAQLWDLLKWENQIFVLKYNGNGYYSIINKKSGKYLEVEGGYKEAGTNVQQYNGNGTDAQQWVIKPTGDGFYYITSKCNGLYLDVDKYNTDNGTNIKVYTGNLSNAQKWKFIQNINPTEQPTEPSSSETQPTESQPITDKTTETTQQTEYITNTSTEPTTTNPTEVTTKEEVQPTSIKPTTEPVTKPVIVEPTEPQPTTPVIVNKKTNPIKVTVKAQTVKLKKLKKKGQTVKAIAVKNTQGKVSYKLVKKGSTASLFKYVKINSKGVITLKKWKRAKKGTYKIKVTITVAGNTDYKKKSVSKTLKIKVK